MTEQRNVKGVILAAGFGTRFKPLTGFIPKPALPFASVPSLWLAMWRLEQAGIKSCAVNSHHLADKIHHAIENCPIKLDIFSAKEDKILGTGGVFSNLAKWRGDSTIVALNADVVSDIELQPVIELHQTQGNLATMVMLDQSLQGKTRVYCGDGRVAKIGGEPPRNKHNVSTHTFTGIHILSNEFFRYLPESGPSEIIPAYRSAIADGQQIGCCFHNGFWADIGDPTAYWIAHKSLLTSNRGKDQLAALGVTDTLQRLNRTITMVEQEQEFSGIQGPAMVVGNPTLSDGCQVGPWVVMGDNLKIGQNAKIFESALFNDVTIRDNEIVVQQIIAPEARVNFRP